MKKITDKAQFASGVLLAVLGGMSWGLSGSMGEYLFDYEGMDSRWLVPIRLFMAGVILFVYSLARYGRSEVFRPWKGRRSRIDLLIYGILGISMCQFTYFLTIQLANAAIGTIMQDLSPMMILLCICVLERRKPAAAEIISIALALGGVILIVTHGDLSHFAVSPAAILAGTVSSIGVTIYNVYPKQLLASHPLLVLQSWAFLMGGAVLGMIFHPWTWGYVPSAIGLLGIAFVVVVGNVVAFTAYMAGVKRIGPEKAILFGFAEPVTAAIVGVALLGNQFTLWDAAGFILIFLMMVLLSRSGK